MSKLKFFAFFAIAIFVFSCNKDGVCTNSEHVIMRNFTGLDGCAWVLQLDDNSKLEPQNLNDFEIEFVEGKSLHVTYKEIDAGSICMVGKIVEIKCLTED